MVLHEGGIFYPRSARYFSVTSWAFASCAFFWWSCQPLHCVLVTCLVEMLAKYNLVMGAIFKFDISTYMQTLHHLTTDLNTFKIITT